MKAITEFYNMVVQHAVFPTLQCGKVAEVLFLAKQEIEKQEESEKPAE